MTRRTVLLAAAVLVAAVGTLLVFLYVQGVDQRATTGQGRVRLLVATREIPAGKSGAEINSGRYVALRSWPADVQPTGALGDLSGVLDRVTRAPIAAGEPLLAGQFGEAVGPTGLEVSKGMLKLAIPFDAAARVDNTVQPGSWVAVFATLTSTFGSGTARPGTQLLLPRVQVFDVGGSDAASTDGNSAAGSGTNRTAAGGTTGRRGGATGSDSVTLIVTVAEAQKLLFAEQNGTLHLSLIEGNATPTPGLPVDANNLFSS